MPVDVALTEAGQLMAEYLTARDEVPPTWARQLALMVMLATFHAMAIQWTEDTFGKQAEAMGPMMRAVFELGRACGRME